MKKYNFLLSRKIHKNIREKIINFPLYKVIKKVMTYYQLINQINTCVNDTAFFLIKINDKLREK